MKTVLLLGGSMCQIVWSWSDSFVGSEACQAYSSSPFCGHLDSCPKSFEWCTHQPQAADHVGNNDVAAA